MSPKRPTVKAVISKPAPKPSGNYPHGAQIVRLEARFDAHGNPIIYKLPANDGGGTHEIAGINSRYHPSELRKLQAMPPSERFEECARYVEDYTRGGCGLRNAEKFMRDGTLFFVLDTAFNRGAGGACRITQDALVSLGYSLDSMGGRGWGPKTRGALARADKSKPEEIVSALRESRESYERRVVGVRKNFWQGLVNRWDKTESIARSWNGKEIT